MVVSVPVLTVLTASAVQRSAPRGVIKLAKCKYNKKYLTSILQQYGLKRYAARMYIDGDSEVITHPVTSQGDSKSKTGHVQR
jgi:hypothetical protein